MSQTRLEPEGRVSTRLSTKPHRGCATVPIGRFIHHPQGARLGDYFPFGRTVVMRPLTMGLRSSGPPQVSGSATQVPSFMRV